MRVLYSHILERLCKCALELVSIEAVVHIL